MEKTKQKQITDFLINNGVIIVMFILVIVAGLTTQNFFTLNNLNNLLNNIFVPIIYCSFSCNIIPCHNATPPLRI